MKEEKLNLKSDIPAKKAFSQLLLQKGYSEVKIVSFPVDIIAIKEGVKHYFEIKYTTKKDKYFGAATLTEWISAMENPNNFRFVIARKENDSWKFIEYTPNEFMEFNTIPPFKTYFNIFFNKNLPKKLNRIKKSIKLTRERLNMMKKFWISLKN